MSKQEFLGALYNGLSGLPKEDIENSVQFYSEMTVSYTHLTLPTKLEV